MQLNGRALMQIRLKELLEQLAELWHREWVGTPVLFCLDFLAVFILLGGADPFFEQAADSDDSLLPHKRRARAHQTLIRVEAVDIALPRRGS